MKMIKNNIVKEISENLVPAYQAMGWTIYKEKKAETKKTAPKDFGRSFSENKEENTNEEIEI